jgi:hypothetical protein
VSLSGWSTKSNFPVPYMYESHSNLDFAPYTVCVIKPKYFITYFSAFITNNDFAVLCIRKLCYSSMQYSGSSFTVMDGIVKDSFISFATILAFWYSLPSSDSVIIKYF